MKEEDVSVMDILVEKANKIVKIDDFKGLNKNEINQIKELKELKDYIIYPYKVIHTMYLDKMIFRLPCDYNYYYREIIDIIRIRDTIDILFIIPDYVGIVLEYLFCPERISDEWQDILKIKKYFKAETIVFGLFGLLTYFQPFCSSLSVAFVHAYIFKKNIQNYFEFYEYQKNIMKDVFLRFHNDQNSSFKDNKKYYLRNGGLWKENIKICSTGAISLDNLYLNFCKNNKDVICDTSYSAYDVKNNIIVDIEKDYMIAAYLDHDTYLLVKTKENFIHKDVILDMQTFTLLEIGIGKKIDNKITLIKSIERYSEKITYPSTLNLSKDETKLFIKLRNNIQIFTLSDSNFSVCDKILEADYQSINFIKQLQRILQYIALVLFLYQSNYFSLRNKHIEERNTLIERKKWYEYVISRMFLYKNIFLKPIKRFLRQECIRIPRQHIYGREWAKMF